MNYKRMIDSGMDVMPWKLSQDIHDKFEKDHGISMSEYIRDKIDYDMRDADIAKKPIYKERA